ncbi:MAG: hypothetical protein RR632_07540 [Christensenella sp.]
MYTIEVTILVAVIGCFVCLAGWLSTRDKKIANDSEWRGEVNAKLDAILGVKQDVKDLANKVGAHETRITAVEASARQAHKRMDEHIK